MGDDNGDDVTTCPRCGRLTDVFDLTATSITCPHCDPAWRVLRDRDRGRGDGDRQRR